jgi:predicted RNase H-like HicB family nuclease
VAKAGSKNSRPAKGFVILTGVFRREGKWVTAECTELGTATFGRSLEEADKKLREAILLNLQGLEDAGERSRFFREHRIRMYTDRPSLVTERVPPGVFARSHVLKVDEEFALTSA